MNIFKIKFVKSIFAGTISFGLLFFNTAPFVMASDISGVTPTQQGGHNVYNIEGQKFSGSTQFRHYNNFNLSQGDVANLIYRLGYDKFVNLVNSQVNINGILNTMRDNNFFNGRAIFVSPGGVVIGASGVLNVGSLTLMAPSQNAYNAFKKMYDNDSQLSKIEYNINNENYKSLITNSSGTITINGKIFAKDGVEAYARQINIKKDSSNEGNSPAIFAGVQNQTVMSDYSDATSLFNSLVSSDFTSANGYALQNGKIALVTNKYNEENITTQTEDNKTVTINVNTGLKTTTTGSGDSATKAYAIDKTYSSSSLSSDDSVINIEDANIISNEIDIQANATSTKEVTKSSIENYGKSVKESENTGNNTNNNKKDETTGYKISDSFKNVAPEAVAKVTISNSKVSGEKVSVKANATNKTENYIQLIDPVWEKWLSSFGSDVLNTILSTMGMDTDNETSASAGDMISQYFSDDAYTYLDGAKATSSVTIKDDSKILAKDSVIIEAVADATTKITTGELDSHPLFMYGLGVKANSDVKITDSNIKTSNDGKVNVNAYSKTSDNIKYDSSKFLAISNTPTNNSSSESSNNSSQDNTNNNSNNNNNNNNTSENNNNSNNNQSSQQNTVSAYNLTLLNNSIISAANVEINGSTIDTKDLSLNSIGFNKGETYLTNVSHIGENADKTGIAATFLINHVDTKSNVEIKNNSKITTGNDVNLLSQNINYIDNYIETEVKAKNQTYPVKTKIGTTFNPTYSIKAYELLNKKILNKVTDKIGNVLDKANLEISGSAIWNDEQNTSNAIVNDSTINAKNISIISNMVDLVANGAEAYATAGNKFSAGMAIVVNDQNDSNNAKIINGSKINAESGLNVNATTQLPMNPMELKIGKSTTANPYELNLYIGASFDQSEDSITDWDADFIHTQLKNLLNKDTATKIKNGIGNNPVKYIRDSKVVLDGLFNNYAKAEGTGETLGVAGSVVANSILNNTNAFIDGSQVNITNGDVSINASNSVVNYNGAGKVDFILEEINDFINGANDDVKSKFGVGGSVLVNTFTNNDNAYINNSKIIADKGDINVNSASEEAYVNLTVTGGKSQTLAVDGSVNVQNINGKTLAYIEKAEEIKANNVSVNAGKAKIKPKKSSSDDDGDPVELNKDTKQLSVGDEREIKDSVLNISILGVNSKTEGSGASVGASVNAANSNRETKAYINDSKITTEKDVSVTAANNAKNIGVVLAGAFAGGVSTDKQTQQNANENNTSENNSTSNNNSNNESSSSENSPQKMENAGNWMDILDNASDDDNDVLGLQNLFDENNANKEGAQKAQDQVGNNTTKLADGTADPQSATKNFSLALAGAVSVVNDNSSVTSEIIKSTINVGDKLKVTSDRDNLVVNIAGGLAKSGNVGGGAAVNVYSDKGKAVSKISEAIITFTSNNAKNLEVVSSNNHDLINGAIGIGVASNNQQGVKAAVGGSFNTNILKNTTNAIIYNTTIQNTENIANDIDINVNSNSNTNVWNVGGDLGFANANNSFALGAGVAGNYNLLKQSVEAEIIGSTLTNAKNINTKAELTQKLNSISVAGAIVSGAKSSFTIDGALGIDLIANEVLASLSGSTVSSTGDIDVVAISNITGQNLTGGLEFSSSNNSAGVGIGSVTEVDNSNITAKINNSTIEKSNSIDVNANSKDDRKFLAANLGAQTGSGTTIEINANGIISVLKSTVDALVMGGSTLSSDGDINVLSNYTNINQGITTVADVAKDGLALGANVILNHYGNEITSNIANDSNILKSGNIGVGAKSSEYINVIPVAISFATGGAGAVAADVVVNVIEDKTNAIAAGILNTDGNLTVASDGETTIYNRGGTLAVSSANALAAFGGAINVDYIGKTVNAKIGGDSYTYTDETGNEHTVKNKVKAEGNVSATAVSTNSIGGTPTKDSSGNYKRDDITSSNYQDKLMKKNSNEEYTGINYNNDFSNWNMFYNLSAGANAAISGTVIVKTIENEVTAEIANADVTANNLNIKAEDYSIKNIIAGQIGASSTAAVGVQVLVTKDNSDTSALISNESDITVKNALNINAENIKDNNQIVAAGNFASNVAVGANVLHNTISDNTIAKIDSSKVKSNKLKIAANEDINASRIVVAASGSGQGVALNVSPLINYYGDTTGNSNEADKRGKTIAEISNSTINDALITLQSDTNIKTRDIAIGVAGAGQGFAASGLAIRNNYDTITKAIIDAGSIINTSKDINVNANSVANANNWIVGVSGVGEGASIIANVIINDLASTVETNISDSTIVNADNIVLNTNKDKQDELNNYAISGNVAGIGAAASANVIYNIYENDVVSKIYNTEIENSNLITTQAFSDRALKNINIGLSVTGIGADLLANAIVNEIGTDTLSFVDAQSNRINTNGKLTVKAEDKTFAENKIGFGVGAGLGAALGTNINLYYSDNLARAEVLSNSDGQINAGSTDISSNIVSGLDNENVGVAVGLVGLAGDVLAVKLGKHVDYTDSEKTSGIEDADKKVNDIYEDTTKTERNFREENSSKLETGAISRIKGNLKAKNNIDVKAESKLKGKGNSDILSLTNVQTTAGLGEGSVAVRDIQLANNTIAEISGGKVESTNGNISLNAKNTANVNIKNVEVHVSGLKFSGGSAIYNNNSETIAQIGSLNDETTVNSKNGINVISNSTSKSNIDTTNVVVTGGEIVAVDLSENKDNNNGSAMIVGKTNINTGGKLALHSTVSTDLSSIKSTVSVVGASMVSVSKNEAEASTITKAVMENVEGKIIAKGIDIITDYDKMSVYSKANVTAIKFGSVYSGDSSGSKMNAKFTSGIYKSTGTIADAIIENLGKTTIETAKQTGINVINSKSEINNVAVSLQGFVAETSANAENTAESNTYLMAISHNSDALDINSYLNSKTEATAGATKATVGIGVNVASTDATDKSILNVNVNGANKVNNIANINASHNSEVSSDMSAFNFGGLVGGGQRIRVASELVADTTGNIGGDFNSGATNIIFNTVRNSTMSKGSKSGSGIVNVSDFSSLNKLTGTSTLNIDSFKSNNNSINKLSIKNISTNTFDITSSDSSGGFINVSNSTPTKELNTSTITNIIDSTINSGRSVAYNTQNNTIVKDTASLASGGFVNIMSNSMESTYKSAAELSLKNSTISANDINVNTLSDISSAKNDYVDYSASGGGFVAGQKLSVKNTLDQTSKINLENSKLLSEQDLNISAKTTSKYKQRIDNKSSGFVSLPTSESRLVSNNTQEINLDNNSQIKSQGTTTINLDTSNALESRVSSIAKNFAGAPEAYSYVTATINNTINNRGQIGAGNLVDINFMNSSVNNLTVYAYTQNDAAVAKTNEGGELKKAVNNTLNVFEDAQIISNKDIDINYSTGSGLNKSTVAWDTTSYLLFGIPIHNSDESHPISTPIANALNLNGEIIAGMGNSKYMRINQDGSIDVSATTGFSASDYELIRGSADGQVIKDEKLASIQIKIDNTERALGDYQTEYDALSDMIESLDQQRNDIVNNIYKYLEGICTYKRNGTLVYTVLNNIPNEEGNSDFSNKIISDFKSLIVGNASNKISESTYNTIFNDYKAKVQEQSDVNTNKISTFMEFFKEYNNGLTSTQKITIENTINRINNNISIETPIKISVYKDVNGNFYAGLKNPHINANGNYETDERTYYLAKTNDLLNEINSLYNSQHDIRVKLSELNQSRSDLRNQYNTIDSTPAENFVNPNDKYSIVFKDVNLDTSYISVDGITNKQITGTGKFDVGSALFQIDNYSTRSLIFNDIDLTGATAKSSLSIDGKSYSNFANSDKAVNGTNAYNYIYGNASFDSIGTSGAHYTNGGSGASGIIINNYYDNTHPFAKTLDIPNPTLASDIIFNSLIKSYGDFKIFNDSGSIIAKNIDTDILGNSINLVATKGNVDLTSNSNINLDIDNLIFAGNSVKIKADTFHISPYSRIIAGYNSDLNLTITESMLDSNFLRDDPVTGERILINEFRIGNYNNVKAVYKDNTIHLFNINKPLYDNIPNSDRGKIDISYNTSNSLDTIFPSTFIYDGYQNINIENETNKQLVVHDINNIKSEGGLYINNEKIDPFLPPSSLTANTNINTASSNVVLNGIILNQLDKNYQPDASTVGVLKIQTNGLEVTKQTDKDGNVLNSILSSGIVDISSENEFVYGNHNILGNITNTNVREDSEFSIKINNSGNTTIGGAITSNTGNIIIKNDGELNLTQDSVIKDNNGDISISNNGNLANLSGKLENENGNININNTTPGLASGMNVGGVISVENGDINILNNLGNMTVSAEINHNVNNQDAQGMISIYNNDIYSNRYFDIQSDIKSYGAGKYVTENDNTILKAIEIIDNSNSREFLLSNAISSRVGDIYIKSNSKNFNSTADISNIENGNIYIETLKGNAILGGKITAKEGNIDIFAYENAYSLDIFESLITNQKGDINITTQALYNLLITKSVIDNIKANTTIVNSSNNFIIDEGTVIKNIESGDIAIENEGRFSINDASLRHLGTGNITIKNYFNYEAADESSIVVNNGNIDIENHIDTLLANGTIQNANGNITITNFGTTTNIGGSISNENGDITITNTKDDITITNNGTSASIGGSISNENGDITITNTKDDITISAKVNHNKLNQNSQGMISIINDEDAGKLDIQSAIQTFGKGKTVDEVTTAILINNQSATDGLTMDNASISARIGDVVIKNKKNDLNITSGTISNTEQGNIAIINSGSNFTNTASIYNTNGNIIIQNQNNKMQLGGSIMNQKGNTGIVNLGNTSLISANIKNENGNIDIKNEIGELNISGSVSNKEGDVLISNYGEHTEISNAINNENGLISIRNENGSLNVTNNGSIINTSSNDNSYNVDILNYGTGLSIAGDVGNNKGNISVINHNGVLETNGSIQSFNGNIDITNNGTSASIGGSVTNQNGNTNITNYGDTTTISATIRNNNGNTSISNANGKLTASGDIYNKAGDILIENFGENTEISGVISNENGLISIFNHNSDFDIKDTSLITNTSTDGFSHDISITNYGSNMSIAGEISNEKGDINLVNNSDDGSMSLSALIQDFNGNIDIANNGTTTNIGGSIIDEKGNITITNAKGDMTISSLINHNINNQNAKGMISITNGANAGKLDIQSSIQTKGSGKIQTIDEIERNVAILIDNQSTTNGLTIDNALISARIGDIIIKNKKNDLNIASGTISNTENGNISITNADTANVLRVDADVKALNEGNINIINNGSDDTTISGAITANTGNINIENINGGNTSLLGVVATTKGNVDITNNNSGNIIVSAVSNSVGNINIKNNNSGDLTLKGNINNNVQGNIIISQENSGKMNILSDINANDGIISILNINSGDIKIDTHAGITSEKGEIQIYNEGSSDIYQYGQVVAFNGNVGIWNTEGAIYSQGAVVAQEDNVVIANTIGDLVLNSLYGANNGNVQIFNYNGNLYFDEDAMIVNTKSSSDDTNYGISIVNINNDNVLGMYLNGHILNYGGGDIDISNYGNDGAVIGGYIFNEIGNINISNATKALELTGVVTTSNGGNISIVNTGDDGIRLSDGNRISSDGGFVSITNYSNDFVMEEGAKIDVFYRNNNNITDIYLKNESTAGKMTISGKIENEGIKGLNIINNSTSGIELGETAKILNKQTNTVISNTAGELNIKNGAEILNTQNGDIKVENTGNKLTIAGLLKNLGEGNIELSNTGSDGINIEGTVNTAKQNITVTNKDSDINIGKFGTTNDTYIKADIGNVVINQTNGNLVNSVIDSVVGSNRQNSDLGNPNPAYKTLISTGNDLVINIVDGNIGSAISNAATSTNASTRDYTDSINVSVAGNITATAKNTNSTDKRLVNLRSKEADMNIEKIDVDGDVVLTSVDWKQADNINGSSDSEYYKGYSVNNAANSGDYAIKAQNVSIIASNDIGSENNKLTILQDKLGNANSTLNTFAENSIYYDISSNDTNNNLSIGTLRTKSQYGTIGLDLSSNANIDTIAPGGSVAITQKVQDLTINNISMYRGNNVAGYNISEDILYPHDRLGANTGGSGRLVLKALDAYANDKPHSNLVVNNAYIYGRGLNDSDVELHADNVVFNAISKSNISNKPVVFDIQGVSKEDINSIANSTRNNYKNDGGHYLANNAVLNIETDKNNNYGAIINTIYATDANIKTNNTNLSVNKGFISDYATFTNGNMFASGYNHIATVNNRSKGLIPTHVQMFTQKTGDFNLGMNGSIVINTNAPVVHYSDEVLVNGYNSENSFTRLTLKENIVQQVAKDMYKNLSVTDISSLKAEYVKLDTSNIITNEIINYTSSSNEINDEDENKNISLEKEEKVGG